MDVLAKINETLKDMQNDPELAEVCDMTDEYLKNMQERALNRQEPNKDYPLDPEIIKKAKIEPEWPGEKYLDIEVIFDPEQRFDGTNRSGFAWTAHYSHKPKTFGQGSTAYMAILDLINNINPSVEAVECRYKPKSAT